MKHTVFERKLIGPMFLTGSGMFLAVFLSHTTEWFLLLVAFLFQIVGQKLIWRIDR